MKKLALLLMFFTYSGTVLCMEKIRPFSSKLISVGETSYNKVKGFCKDRKFRLLLAGLYCYEAYQMTCEHNHEYNYGREMGKKIFVIPGMSAFFAYKFPGTASAIAAGVLGARNFDWISNTKIYKDCRTILAKQHLDNGMGMNFNENISMPSN